MEVTILVSQTVVETSEFIKQAKICMDEETRDLFIISTMKIYQSIFLRFIRKAGR